MAIYRMHSREQIEMKMMCANDFVPEDHKARVIVSIIETLDLSAFDGYFRNDTGGNKAYPIISLLSIFAYAFSEGLSSTRKIEQNCTENIVYRYLCCDDPPDHSTISRFWNRFKDDIEKILIQTVYIGEEQDLIDYKHISGDGVKIKSMRSKSKLFSVESGKKRLENIEKRISKLVDKMDKNISEKEKETINEKIDKQKDLKNRIEKGLEELKELQKEIKVEKKRGEKRERVNYRHITEEDSRLMKKKESYLSGYNAQAMVDSQTNMIISSDVS